MKRTLFVPLLVITLALNAQLKATDVNYNKPIEIVGTEYMIVTSHGRPKKTNTPHLDEVLFANTLTGEVVRFELPESLCIRRVEPILIEELGIRKILIHMHETNSASKMYGDWGNPGRFYICSLDGKEKVQITEDDFDAAAWTVNRKTGVIVVTGSFKENKKKGKRQLLMFSLKEMRLLDD